MAQTNAYDVIFQSTSCLTPQMVVALIAMIQLERYMDQVVNSSFVRQNKNTIFVRVTKKFLRCVGKLFEKLWALRLGL